MLNISALSHIPQRSPFIMVDTILCCEEQHFETDFVIKGNNPLVAGRHFSVGGILENIAQSCAAYIGWTHRDRPVVLGVVGGITRFEVHALPEVGHTLLTRLDILAQYDTAMMVKSEVWDGEILLASGEMKVFLTPQLATVQQEDKNE